MHIRLGALKRRTADGSDSAEHKLDSRHAWLLAVCCVAQFMVILDLSIVNVALPSIQSSLGFSSINLQWVVEAYAIAFAGFLMLGGRAADHFGPRRVLVVALIAFAVASLAGGSAPNQVTLIVARSIQGVSGALMATASLSAITSSFQQGPARHRAIGLWGAMNGAGGAAGALFGGIITQELGWRWVLLINPPVGIAAAFVALTVVADRPTSEVRTGFDLGGALALTGGLMVLVFGIVNAGYLGWGSAGALVPIAIGASLLGLFLLIEARLTSSPLVPPKAFTRSLRVANGIVLLFSAALFPMWYVSSLYLQQVLGLSPLKAGLAFLPMALVIMVSARVAGRLVSRFGVRSVLGGGLVMMTSAMLLFARIGSSGSAFGYVILPGLLMAIGIGLCVVPSTIAATQGAGQAKAGLASGLVNTSRQVGGALGIALLISLASMYTSHLIGENRAVPEALTDGFRLAYLIGAGLCAVAVIVALALLPKAETAPRSFWKSHRVPVGVLAVVGAFVAVDFVAVGGAGAPLGAYTTTGSYDFVSSPDLHPPKIYSDAPTVTNKLAPGYIMLANFFNVTSPPMVGQSGPLIVDNNLQPVWFKPVPTDVVASNLSEQTYEGKPALAWWQGVVTSTGAIDSGEDIVVNQNYQTVATLKGADGWIITLHSFQIEGDDAWVTANKNIPMNLTKYGGANNGALVDSAVQEYNLKTGKLVKSWDALDHIPLRNSYATPPTNGFPWDAYHVNSINLASNGTFVVSMRNTWAAYLVNVKTGRIEWTLGGKSSSFKFSGNAQFQWQHDVVLNNDSEVTLFDDDCCQITGAGTYLSAAGPSRAVVLKLNLSTHTVSVVAQYTHGGNSAAYMGSTQVLANGNVLVGWGELPYFSEYSKDGTLLLEGVFPSPDLSYRATKVAEWIGLPLTPPSGAARKLSGKTTVYASWNGATQVVAWRVLAGSSSKHLTVVAKKPKSGFETSITLGSSYNVFEVEALDARGSVLGSSSSFVLRR